MNKLQPALLRRLSRNGTPQLYREPQRIFTRFSSSTTERQWSTPLAKTLSSAIATTGPISIANYMRQCLTSPESGYYTRAQQQSLEKKDQFGQKGDFITSPEISQIFGELVGIWFLTEWLAQGKKSSGVQLIELGPGRGTMMDDVLRTIKNFKDMAAAIERIYLVEESPMLRGVQKERLCGSDVPTEEFEGGYRSKSKHLPDAEIVWVEDTNFIPKEEGKQPLIVAHEFFDALPIHAFQSVQVPNEKSNITTSAASQAFPSAKRETSSPPQNEWRELLVTTTQPPSVINPPKEPPPEFELTLSPTPTQHSRLLPSISPRYKTLLSSPPGQTVEISPSSRTTLTNLTSLMSPKPHHTSSKTSKTQPTTSTSKPSPPASSASGAILIIDYGPSSTIPINSLRGIKQHTRTSPFTSPGTVDISADVDFGSLVETALEASQDVEVHGPVEQWFWLQGMGGAERLGQMIRKADTHGGGEGGKGRKKVVERVTKGWERLVDRGPNGMGKLYKCLAIVPEQGGKRRPVGFGGQVVG